MRLVTMFLVARHTGVVLWNQHSVDVSGAL